ncbi:hypothetical protein [Wenxinia marina]|uniref:Lipoprotein n=1 Tax=Wenxinia marina DSM 24838 TaxID=1123501 RepID=A0A0D0Q5X4_9RHOB|nr:hypothetical protein [Wenxinia marina]KIQ69879.1 hypothetical protein Wenmar_01449 [Wenxinia marina DSM 24838]GGL61945.1 hypothetical protein GCM10011392_15530 [Wenxinia marina]
MRRPTIVAVILLAGCTEAAPPAGPAPAADYVFVRGGIDDGAAMGQATAFTVTPDDRLDCTFSTRSPLTGEGSDRDIDVTVPGLYARLVAILGPGTAAGRLPDLVSDAPFVAEIGSGGAATWTAIGYQDPRYGQLLDLFFRTPSSCWTFG